MIFEEALMTVDVVAVKDTALVRVEHNWVNPDPPKTLPPDLHLSGRKILENRWCLGQRDLKPMPL